MIEILAVLASVMTLAALFFGYRYFKQTEEVIQLRERNRHLSDEVTNGRETLSNLKEEMKTTFATLAADTLKGSNEELLKLAELKFTEQQKNVNLQMQNKQDQISNVIEPLKNTLNQFFVEVTTMEKARQRSYALVENELKQVIENSMQLSKETRALKNALKKPHVRGRWGEMQLKNCVELAGMSEFADVTFQDYGDYDGRKLIPDMTVKMPGGRTVVVDAKTPIDAFLASLEAANDEQRNTEMVRHGKQIKNHIKELGRKAYNEALKDSADFTVMFLPNESFLYAALETQPDLVEYAMEKKILVATPPTFVGLLKVIRYGWNEEKLTRNAEEISDIGRELHKRIADFMEAYLGIGKSIDAAKEKYEKGLSRLNSRVLSQARKMEALGAKSKKELPAEL